MAAYQQEIENLESTYLAAMQADLKSLKAAIREASSSSIIAVGSGGSYTVASLLCSLHEKFTGMVSRPSTPLEILQNPTLAMHSPAFFVSAEGKNNDIISAVKRTCEKSSRATHVICNRNKSPLSDLTRCHSSAKLHIYELENKDGYLATNSLLYDSVIINRAYQELDQGSLCFPKSFNDLSLNGNPFDDILENPKDFVTQLSKCEGLMVLYSPLFRSVAIDIESKLAESAMLHCQICDLRSFAHGRHSWVTHRTSDISILSIVDEGLVSLWEATQSLLPDNLNVQTINIDGKSAIGLITGLVYAIKLIGRIGTCMNIDPGAPNVPDYARQIHYLPLETVVNYDSDKGSIIARKQQVMGAAWPLPSNQDELEFAYLSYLDSLRKQNFRCIIFDYDGTLCHSQTKDAAPPTEIITHLHRLLESGIFVCIASGRGDSLWNHLKESINITHHNNVYVGLYNCGVIECLANTINIKKESSEFLCHVTRIVHNLKITGAPISIVKDNSPYQVSVRLTEGTNPTTLWLVIADSLRRAGLDLSRIVRSKHSVDILGKDVSKAEMVRFMIANRKLKPNEILTIGDQGDWPGNDFSLLDHPYSLSVDAPSRQVDRGWKLAPDSNRDVSATVFYLDRVSIHDNNFTFNPST